MRHRKRGRHLSRTAAHRRALRRNLAKALFEHERIVTTVAKAKFVRAYAERLITQAKKGIQAREAGDRARYLHHYRRVLNELGDKGLTRKLFGEGQYRETGALAARFLDRPGGYTRILRMAGSRLGLVTGSSVGEVPRLYYTIEGKERTLKAVANRLGDNAPHVILELVGEMKQEEEEAPKVSRSKSEG